jgi:hypothetical protein
VAYAAKRDLLKAGKFTGLAAYLTKVLNVNNGGTIAISGDWIGLPSMKAYTYQRRSDTYDIIEQTGAKTTIKKLLGLDVKTTFNQRDAATYELDQSYVGAESLLLLAGHRFTRMAAPINRTWLAVFGEVIAHDAEINSDNGEVPFMFSGLINAQAIEIGAAGDVAFPSDAGLAAPELLPNANIIIAANGGYKFSDVADT